MKINTLVIDDDENWRLTLSKMVESHPALNLVATCKSATEAYACLLDNQVDLLLCDIEIGDMSGLMLARTLQPKPLIIFVTAHRHYAFDCYEVSPVDFLLKPLERERFWQSIEKARQRLGHLAETEPIEPFFIVKENTHFVQIRYSEVLYVKAREHFVQIVTTDKMYMPALSISSLEKNLRNGVLLRVHRSYLVQRGAIRLISKNDITLINGKKIPIGDQYRTHINQQHIDPQNVGKPH